MITIESTKLLLYLALFYAAGCLAMMLAQYVQMKLEERRAAKSFCDNVKERMK